MKKYSLIIFIILLFLLTLIVANDILAPFVFGFIFAYLFSPIVTKMENINFSRTTGSMIVITSFILFMILILIILIPPLVHEARGLVLLSSQIPELIQENVMPFLQQNIDKLGFEFRINNIVKNVDNTKYLNDIFNYSSLGINKIYTTGLSVVSSISLMLLSPFVAFYFLKDWNILTRKSKKIIPAKYKNQADDVMKDINNVLSGYIRGQFILCSLMVIYYMISLSFIKMNNALIIGLISGLAVILPYAGAIISAIIAVIAGLMQFKSLDMTLIIALIYILGQGIEGNFIAPKLIGEKIQLNPLWIIFAMLVGGNLLGLYGIIISIPIAGVLGVVIRHLLDYYYNSDAYNT